MTKEEQKIYNKEYREKNKEVLAQKNKEKWANRSDEYREAHKEYCKKYYKENKKTKREYERRYWEENKIKLNEKKRLRYNTCEEIRIKKLQKNQTHRKNKIESDTVEKMKHIMRTMINNALRKKNYTKKSKTQEILGCTYKELKIHIENQFDVWMNWDNYGNINGNHATKINQRWQIDHQIPLSSAKTEEELIKLNHYTNLQPLCSYTNMFIKKARY